MSHSQTKSEGAWMLPLITNQILAYSIILVLGLLISLLGWQLFMSIDGNELPNTLYWIISLIIWIGPQIGLRSSWLVTIPTQITVEIIIRGQRTGFWLNEGKYIVPFFEQLITFNIKEIQHTSKTDVSVSDILTYDKRGEELLVDVTAEKKIANHSKYEEFDETTMAINEKDIIVGAITRMVQKKIYWTEIIGQENELIIEDDIFKSRCAKYGITLTDIVFVIRVKDMTIQSLIAKRKRLIEELIQEHKDATNQTHLTSKEMSGINDRAEVIIGKAQKQFIDGVPKGNIYFRAGGDAKP